MAIDTEIKAEGAAEDAKNLAGNKELEKLGHISAQRLRSLPMATKSTTDSLGLANS